MKIHIPMSPDTIKFHEWKKCWRRILPDGFKTRGTTYGGSGLSGDLLFESSDDLLERQSRLIDVDEQEPLRGQAHLFGDGAEFHDLPIAADGIVELPVEFQKRSTDQPKLDRQRRGMEALDQEMVCLIAISATMHRKRKITQSFGVVVVEPQRLLELFAALLLTTERRKHQTEGVEEIGISAKLSNGAAHCRDCLIRFPHTQIERCQRREHTGIRLLALYELRKKPAGLPDTSGIDQFLNVREEGNVR